MLGTGRAREMIRATDSYREGSVWVRETDPLRHGDVRDDFRADSPSVWWTP